MRPCIYQDGATSTCKAFDDPDDGSPMVITVSKGCCIYESGCSCHQAKDLIG